MDLVHHATSVSALAHPLMPGASPLADDLDMVKRLEDAGASAIVMRSLFEEQIVREQLGAAAHLDAHDDSFAEALSYVPPTSVFALGPDTYLEQLRTHPRGGERAGHRLAQRHHARRVDGLRAAHGAGRRPRAGAQPLRHPHRPEGERPGRLEERLLAVVAVGHRGRDHPRRGQALAVLLVAPALRPAPLDRRGARRGALQPLLPAGHRRRGSRRGAHPPPLRLLASCSSACAGWPCSPAARRSRWRRAAASTPPSTPSRR